MSPLATIKWVTPPFGYPGLWLVLAMLFIVLVLLWQLTRGKV